MVNGARDGLGQGAQTLHGVANIFDTKQAAFLSKVLYLQLRMPSRWSTKISQEQDGISSGHFVGVQPVHEIWKSKDVAKNNRLHACHDEVSLSQDIDTVDTAQGSGCFRATPKCWDFPTQEAYSRWAAPMAWSMYVGIPNTSVFRHWGTEKKMSLCVNVNSVKTTKTRLQYERKTSKCTASGRKSSHGSHPAGPT
jgi:hypothetical protein